MKNIIFHHDDADGILAAAIVNYFIEGEKEFISSSYGMKIDMEKIDVDDNVIIVDFSFPPNIMENLCLIAENVIWIDHHISAINIWNDYLEKRRKEYPGYSDIDGIRDVGLSGCELTEIYFSKKYGKNPKSWRPEAVNSRLVETIGTFDTWKKNNKYVSFEDANKCMIGFVGEILSPEDKSLLTYFNEEYSNKEKNNDKDLTESFIEYGNIVLKYLNNFQNKKISNNHFISKILGHSAVVVNCPLKGSSPLIDSYTKSGADIMCIYFFDGDKWQYSFYTEKENIDVSLIARMLSKDDTGIGGGHKKAAGCTLTKNIFDNYWKNLPFEKTEK